LRDDLSAAINFAIIDTYRLANFAFYFFLHKYML